MLLLQMSLQLLLLILWSPQQFVVSILGLVTPALCSLRFYIIASHVFHFGDSHRNHLFWKSLRAVVVKLLNRLNEGLLAGFNVGWNLQVIMNGLFPGAFFFFSIFFFSFRYIGQPVSVFFYRESSDFVNNWGALNTCLGSISNKIVQQ